MFKRVLAFVFSALLFASGFAYAGTLQQPSTVGPHDISELPHIGTLVCIADNVQSAVYGDVDELWAIVVFHNGNSVIAAVTPNSTTEYFIRSEKETWESTTLGGILQSPLGEIVRKVHSCRKKMQLD